MTATQTLSEKDATMVSELNSLLRGELSAVETYDQAISKFDTLPGQTELKRIRSEHNTSAKRLTKRVTELGGEPDATSGLWGTWATTVAGAAKLLGPQTVLVALREGEEHGIKEYEDALKSEGLCSTCHAIIRSELLPPCQSHVKSLEAMMAKV